MSLARLYFRLTADDRDVLDRQSCYENSNDIRIAANLVTVEKDQFLIGNLARVLLESETVASEFLPNIRKRSRAELHSGQVSRGPCRVTSPIALDVDDPASRGRRGNRYIVSARQVP